MVSEPGLCFVQQFFQGRARMRITNDSLPLCVAVQFRHERGQILRQPLSLLGRKGADCRFDLLNGAHGKTVAWGPSADKRNAAERAIIAINYHPLKYKEDYIDVDAYLYQGKMLGETPSTARETRAVPEA